MLAIFDLWKMFVMKCLKFLISRDFIYIYIYIYKEYYIKHFPCFYIIIILYFLIKLLEIFL